MRNSLLCLILLYLYLTKFVLKFLIFGTVIAVEYILLTNAGVTSSLLCESYCGKLGDVCTTTLSNQTAYVTPTCSLEYIKKSVQSNFIVNSISYICLALMFLDGVILHNITSAVIDHVKAGLILVDNKKRGGMLKKSETTSMI